MFYVFSKIEGIFNIKELKGFGPKVFQSLTYSESIELGEMVACFSTLRQAQLFVSVMKADFNTDPCYEELLVTRPEA